MEQIEDEFTAQFRTMPQPPSDGLRQSLHRTGSAVGFDAETIRAIQDRQDAIAAERNINRVAESLAARTTGIIPNMQGLVAEGAPRGITTTSDRVWPDPISQRESYFRHFEPKIFKLEEKLSGAKTAIEMLIEEYGKLAKKLDEREEEHAMLISELYKLKKAGENNGTCASIDERTSICI